MGSPIRILHVVVNMNRGGAETLIMNLYRHMDRSKVQFDFLTCKAGDFDGEITRMGGRIHRIPYVTEIGPIGFNRELKQLLMKNPVYKIIHSHLDKMSGIVLRAARKAKVPVRIAHSHNTESEGGLAGKAFKSYAGHFIRTNATHLFACSEAAANWLFKQNAQKAVILKNGIEIGPFKFSQHTRESVRKGLNINKDTFIIGHVGRFAKQKNHLYLLDIFKQITKKIPDSVLILIGDGSTRPKIEARIKALKLESKVKLLGVRDDTHALLQSFDLFVFPSLHEGLPVTLIEAQATGLPCLISDRITKEVDMGAGLVEYLSLQDTESWVRRIMHLHHESHPRTTDQKGLINKGYDIRKTAEATQASYLALKEKAI